MPRLTTILLAGAALLPLAAPPAARAQQPDPNRVLRIAPSADLRTLDPVAASIVITRIHGMMIYESLFAWDSKLESKPQMVDQAELSPDGLTWTFRLREGLRFHDGQPVTTRDVIPSLNRWMARDTLGGKLRGDVAGMAALDERRFTLTLKRPTGLVTFALGSAVGNIPAIMREQDATSDPAVPITATVGSGPFRFNRDAWRQGALVVYDRNTDYVPRAEPADGLAGGRVVKVDRVEWHVMPDPMTAANALQTGEIDLWEQPAQDILPTLSRARDVRIANYAPLPNQALLRPNSMQPPFDKPLARQALALATDQGDFLAAGFGEERWWKRCNAYFVCGGPNGTTAGTERFAAPNLDAARKLLADSGYRNEPVVIITASDVPWMARMAEVAADSLRRIGANVDLQFMDWGTVGTRLRNQGPAAQGGWSLFVTSASGATMQSPATNLGTNMSCERAWVGWPCDAEAERLRAAAIDAPDAAARATAVEALHRRLAEQQPYRLLGQYDQPYAHRANVTPVLQAPVMVFWNVEKR
ncbi:ABC transporter substrate-binding protein [Roseomonas sp. OT10]|uniref:ABC transporter substrate-binding protein n=1 Tax=Roseomonas cutis TaxID=2897332 RepID=UPI001E28CE5C|nr:ABC transporter substrate-binding protein [Roseomonas sp. OT10]UFN50596.1 ABC transporter substrate-binding protein [Roseomonas sp. OT10]